MSARERDTRKDQVRSSTLSHPIYPLTLFFLVCSDILFTRSCFLWCDGWMDEIFLPCSHIRGQFSSKVSPLSERSISWYELLEEFGPVCRWVSPRVFFSLFSHFPSPFLLVWLTKQTGKTRSYCVRVDRVFFVASCSSVISVLLIFFYHSVFVVVRRISLLFFYFRQQTPCRTTSRKK